MAKSPQSEEKNQTAAATLDETNTTVGKIDVQTADHSTGVQGDTTTDLVDTVTTKPELLTVVVAKGRSVKHEGVLFSEHQKLNIDYEDAENLISCGYVIALDDLRAQALARESAMTSAVQINVNDGVKITKED